MVADFSFRLLRKYFPDANITLICVEYIVELAEELGLPIRLLAFRCSVGGEQHNKKVALGARNGPMTRLTQVAPSQREFGLAIHIPIADDTRELQDFLRQRPTSEAEIHKAAYNRSTKLMA
jgi:hypothetical protein